MTQPSLINKVSPQQLLAHLKALEGERHPFLSRGRLTASLQYVRDCWISSGLNTQSYEFSYMGASFVNLIARPLIHQTAPARLIIGAHIDTVAGSPGADDNASGVAALLELSRIFAKSALPLCLEFALFNLEELGMIGSRNYAAMLKRNKTKLLGMISLEMLGFTENKGLQKYPWFLRGRFPPTGTYIGLAGNNRSRQLLGSVAQAMRSIKGLPVETLLLPGKGWVFPESRLSDHSPFWDSGFPALLLTDTSFFRNPHYHQPTDTVETLDLAFLERVTKGLVATIEQLTS